MRPTFAIALAAMLCIGALASVSLASAQQLRQDTVKGECATQIGPLRSSTCELYLQMVIHADLCDGAGCWTRQWCTITLWADVVAQARGSCAGRAYEILVAPGEAMRHEHLSQRFFLPAGECRDFDVDGVAFVPDEEHAISTTGQLGFTLGICV